MKLYKNNHYKQEYMKKQENYMLFPKNERKGKIGKRDIETKLDIVYSRFIRARDCGGVGGVGRCFTCQQPVSYFDGECGHFIQRRIKATRWYPINAHLQCKPCNHSPDRAIKAAYRGLMIKKYGEDTVLSLEFQNFEIIGSYWGIFNNINKVDKLYDLLEIYKFELKRLEMCDF